MQNYAALESRDTCLSVFFTGSDHIQSLLNLVNEMSFNLNIIFIAFPSFYLSQSSLLIHMLEIK